MLAAVAASPFIAEINDVIAEFKAQNGTSVRFLGGARSGEAFLLKPAQSVVNKIYRENCVENDDFPNEPKKKWMLQKDAFSRLYDIVRTTIVCLYLDEPAALAQELAALAQKNGQQVRIKPIASNRGYYAYHFNVQFSADFPVGPVDSASHTFWVEIQIITQLQETLRSLTHGIYERLRVDREPTLAETSWSFRSDQFQAAFLGHTMHHVEAMLVQLKDTLKAGEKQEGELK